MAGAPGFRRKMAGVFMSRSFALIGFPLGHSVSPQLHRRLFELSGHSAGYTLLELPPGTLQDAAAQLRQLAGFNVTIPYKAQIIPLLDKLDPSAGRYRSVNTVWCKNGRLVGYNTDVVGFIKGLEQQGLTPTGRVCVVGAGGVGRMFAIEAALRGAEVTIAVRESGLQKAHDLGDDLAALGLGKPSICLTHRLTGPFDLLINATPVGMHPHTNALPVAAGLLDRVDAVFEAIFNPMQTLLLREAAARGCRCVGGMDMLVWQAVAAHEIWDSAVYKPQDLTKLSQEMSALVDGLAFDKEV